MIEQFIIYAIIAGLCVAIPAGPMGTILVWQRMAFFGDALSHTALLGVVLGVITGLNIDITVIVICFVVASLLVFLGHRDSLSTDTVLGISSHATLAFGLIALSVTTAGQTDLYGLLFGDILSVQIEELYWLAGGGVLMLLALALLWKSILMVIINEDLAQVDGVYVLIAKLTFMGLMALIVSMAMKVVGVMLITALLIIPAATARRLSRSPEQMAAFASFTGAVAVLLGISASYLWDWPAGPAIVAMATGAFTVSLLIPLRH